MPASTGPAGPRDTVSICICRAGSLFVDGHCLVFSELQYAARIITEAGLRSDTRQPSAKERTSHDHDSLTPW